MPYVFDTDMLTLYEEGHPRVVGRVAAHPPQELATTVIGVEEPLSGGFTMLRRVKSREALAQVYRQRSAAGRRPVRWNASLGDLSFAIQQMRISLIDGLNDVSRHTPNAETVVHSHPITETQGAPVGS